MSKPLSVDLRERVAEALMAGCPAARPRSGLGSASRARSAGRLRCVERATCSPGG